MSGKFIVLTKERTFTSKTISKLQVADSLYENVLEYVFKVKVETQNDIGYVVCLEMLTATQTATDFMSGLLADIGKINKRIVFQTDKHLNMLTIINKDELLLTWESILPELQLKYKNNNNAIIVLKQFKSQLTAMNTTVEDTMRNKGLYDMIFNGMTETNFLDKKFERNKIIYNFINEAALPFTVKEYVCEQPVIGNETQKWVRGSGKLDEKQFDLDYVRKNIRRISGNAIFHEKPVFDYQEAFRTNDANEMIEARQELRFSIEGFYHSTTKTILKRTID